MRRSALRVAAAMAPPMGAGALPAYKKAAHTDLQPTALERGTGDTPSDPVNRTVSNQVSRAPEPTVLTSRVDGFSRMRSNTDASAGAGASAASAQLTLAQWFGRGHAGADGAATCALSAYLEGLMEADALPLTRTAARTLSRFEQEQLPNLVSQLGIPDVEMVRAQWKGAASAYTKSLCLFDRDAFAGQLNVADERVMSLLKGGTTTEEAAEDANMANETLEAVATILRRDAIIKRNQSLRNLADFCNAAAVRGGQLVWSRFFAAADSMRAELIDVDDATVARYELASKQPLPAMKPVTALLFAVVTAASAKSAGATAVSDDLFANLHHLSHSDVCAFAEQNLGPILEQPNLQLFGNLGFAEAARMLAASVAMRQTSRQQRRALAQEFIDVFADQAASESVIARIAGASEDTAGARDAKQALFTALRSRNLSDGPTVKSALDGLGWKQNYKRIMLDLLSQPGFAAATERAVSSLVQQESQKVIQRGVLSRETIDKLANICRADRVIEDEAARARTAAQRSMLQSGQTQRLLKLLQLHGAELEPLKATVAERIAAANAEVALGTGVYPSIVEEVARRHPKWVSAGIVDPASDCSIAPEAAPALRLLLQAYLRMTYVPATGAAMLAKRFRNRIGPVAKDVAETSLVGEVGFAEHYDMLEYKKYDWQGWYQRMVDVHNRNVSLRCSVNDLRVLDAKGRPFVDMQTERRLRIVAGERVANGIVKLDSDRFEDQADNLEFGTLKVQELLSEAKKAQLGEEYWPSVEVKVRRPSGQTKLHYSTLDWDRVEEASTEAFKKYAEKKKTSLFVSPSDTWLPITGMSAGKVASVADADGYTVDSLFESLDGDKADAKTPAAKDE